MGGVLLFLKWDEFGLVGGSGVHGPKTERIVYS